MYELENRHLLSLIEEVQTSKKVPKYVENMLYKELLISEVTIPTTDSQHIQLMCHESNMDEFFIPAFTSMDYFEAFFNHGEFIPQTVYYGSLINSLDDKTTGIMINPGLNSFFIETEVLKNLNPIKFPPVGDTKAAKKSEVMDYVNQFDNENLLDEFKPGDFLTDKNGKYNKSKFRKLLEIFSKNPLYLLVTTSEKVKPSMMKNVQRKSRFKKLGYFSISHHDIEQLLVFSDLKLANLEHAHKESGRPCFVRLISFPELVRDILEEDFDGIIINHSTKPLFLHRDILLMELENIIENSDNREIDKYYPFCIPIK